MPTRQLLRGDPETKQYLVFNNFAGGINTSDIDDVVGDGEFRMLQNVELGQGGGMLQNRKGFGEMSLLMELLYDKGIEIPTFYDYNPSLYPNRPIMIRIVKNTSNAFAKFEQYDTLADYITATSPFEIKLHILFNLGGTFYLLKVEKEIEATDFTASWDQMLVVDRDDYFPWTAASEQAWNTDGEVGGVYDVSGTDSDDLPSATTDGIYARVDAGSSYLYYVSSTTPATEFVERTLSADAYDFVSKTYILGAAISQQAKNALYVYDSDTESMTKITNKNCYKPTPYEVTSLGGTAALGFNVFALNPLTYIKDQDVGLKSILGVYLTDTDTGAYLEKIPTSGDFTVNVIQYGSSMNPYELDLTFRLGGTSEEKMYTLVTARDIGGIFQYDIVDLDITGVSYFMLDVEKREVWSNIPDEGDFEVLDTSLFPIGTIAHAVSEDTYWALASNITPPNVSNWVEISYNPEETIVSLLGQIFNIGATSGEKEVQSIDLSGARMMLINVVYSNPRMLYYKGNTLWFSEVGQFDFLPNVNFVTLPLDADDEITSVNFYRNTYIIFTKTSIYKMKGDYEAADFSVSLVNANIGCIAPYSVKGVNNSLLFLSADGLYKLTANVYADGIENVVKVDKKIKGLYDVNEFSEAVLYGEQYILFLKYDTYDALHYYYNIGNTEHPFTVSVFAQKPNLVAKLDQRLVSMRSSVFDVTTNVVYLYDKGFSDFAPSAASEEEAGQSYFYTCRVLTTRNSLGYPTHDKKYKSCYLKTYYAGESVIRVTVLVDDFIIVDPNTYKVVKGTDGRISYVLYDSEDADSVISLDLEVAELGEYELGTSPLGDSPFTIHKVSIGSKGNNIQVMLEHKSNGQFGLVSIGHVFKVGKVKAVL